MPLIRAEVADSRGKLAEAYNPLSCAFAVARLQQTNTFAHNLGWTPPQAACQPLKRLLGVWIEARL
jgi:hypothetical protein